MGKSEHVQPVSNDVPENGGSLSPEARADVQDMLEARIAELNRFQDLLEEALQARYSPDEASDQFDKIMNVVKTQPFPSFINSSYDLLEGIFGPISAQAFSEAVKEMKK